MANKTSKPHVIRRAKLTTDQRHEIARRFLNGDRIQDLASEYGVSADLIGRTTKDYAPSVVSLSAFDWVGRQAMYPGGGI